MSTAKRKRRLRVAIIRSSTGGKESVSNAMAYDYRKELERKGHIVDDIDLAKTKVPFADDWNDSFKTRHQRRLSQADAWVVASPTYNWGPSARTSAYLQNAMKGGKHAYKPYAVLGAAGSVRSQGYMNTLANQMSMEAKGIGVGAPLMATEDDVHWSGEDVTGVNTATHKLIAENATVLSRLAEAQRKSQMHPIIEKVAAPSFVLDWVYHSLDKTAAQRDYKREYARDHASRRAKQHRAARNLWNRRLKGKVPAGKEIDHRIPLSSGGGNGKDNIRYRAIGINRANR